MRGTSEPTTVREGLVKVLTAINDSVIVASYSSAIRDLATGRTGPTLAASEFEHTVHIWDIDSGEKVSQFDTIMDFGGRRLAVSRDGAICAAGAYHIHGIAAYDTQDGHLVWQRKDLKKIQALRFLYDGSGLLAFFEVGSAHVLDLRTGATREKLRGVSFIVESPFADARFVNHNGRPEVVDRGQGTWFGPEYFLGHLFVKAAFTEDCLVFNRAMFPRGAGPSPSGLVMHTYCYSLGEQEVLWDHAGPSGFNVLNCGYNAKRREVLLVTWPVEGGEQRLVRVSKDNGVVLGEYPLRGVLAQTAFAEEDTLLVTSSGDVVDTSDGRVVRVLPFPKDSRSGTLVTTKR